MRNLKHILGTLLLSAVLFTSCDEKNDDYTVDRATADEFNTIKDAALEGITQNFKFNAEDGWINLTSENGVSIGINGNSLTLNGNPVTGEVDLEFVEIFNKGTMLVTNKPTMGIIPNGDQAMLITGGEFFINATQNGANLELGSNIELVIPANLTGGVDNDMILWEGNIDENGDLAWDELDRENPKDADAGLFVEGEVYYAYFGSFGWTNVDRFYNDPREKTTILVAVPEGYNNTNSAVYLSYDGEGNSLAKLDTYDASTKLFSEHYGQIPIGLECHVIFTTEESGNWKYAIQAATITENGIITITESQTAVVTEAQMVAAIEALP